MTASPANSPGRPKLPLGVQSFRKLREDGRYYVDKTPHIERLVDSGSAYFLSRPRRFGKSLLLDTVAELFAGGEELSAGWPSTTAGTGRCAAPSSGSTSRTGTSRPRTCSGAR